MICTVAHLRSRSLNIVSLSDMTEGSYCSWDLYTTGQLVCNKKENQFSLNGNGIMSSFLERQFYRSTLYLFNVIKISISFPTSILIIFHSVTFCLLTTTCLLVLCLLCFFKDIADQAYKTTRGRPRPLPFSTMVADTCFSILLHLIFLIQVISNSMFSIVLQNCKNCLNPYSALCIGP